MAQDELLLCSLLVAIGKSAKPVCVSSTKQGLAWRVMCALYKFALQPWLF